MKRIYSIAIVLLGFIVTSCGTDYGFIDTGLSKTHEEKTMYEYFQTDSYNWSLVKQIMGKNLIIKRSCF